MNFQDLKIIKFLELITFFNLIFSTFCFRLTVMCFSLNPLIIGFWIIIQAILTAIILSFIFLFRWLSYILYIVYLGGILILFSYIIRIIPQFTIFPKFNKLNYCLYFTCFIFIFLAMKQKNFIFYEFIFFKKTPIKIIFFCFSRFLKVRIFLFIYLLFIIIIVVFLIEKSVGHFRNI
jgi:NADH-ubiquinone oxidoreductase chain 6